MLRKDRAPDFTQPATHSFLWTAVKSVNAFQPIEQSDKLCAPLNSKKEYRVAIAKHGSTSAAKNVLNSLSETRATG
jgi:hypothetical protein